MDKRILTNQKGWQFEIEIDKYGYEKAGKTIVKGEEEPDFPLTNIRLNDLIFAKVVEQ